MRNLQKVARECLQDYVCAVCGGNLIKEFQENCL